ncbi:copper resistance protein NlpE [[Flexibacter] sp. ATCC 35103]|uniref:copper resistance protein NlpE n=1 Tax=[Flexibacter] sp. ATCC 35103 TaxID=1937528 RepID=UPI0009D2D7A1|nr:copper resistance protein NlpE N-terminal domain-containing protein [[Flexibacter] sp. ATCC 35103]OMQ10437.1 copper homeostasis protein [[Flexibacter] sp. ATCC 35103]
MKKLVVLLVVACQLMSCNSKKKEETIQDTSDVLDSENTENVLGQVMVYEGLLPCADCEGIETVLKIYQGDGTIEGHTFELTSVYKGKTPEKKVIVEGNYNLERGLEKDPDGTIYVLNYDRPEAEQLFYGYSAANPDNLFLLNNKREKIKSKLKYFLTLNE